MVWGPCLPLGRPLLGRGGGAPDSCEALRSPLSDRGAVCSDPEIGGRPLPSRRARSPHPPWPFLPCQERGGDVRRRGPSRTVARGAFLLPASFCVYTLPLGTGLCMPSGQASSGGFSGGHSQCSMEAQSGEPLMHLPEVAPIKSDQEPLLPIDGLVPFHSECAATISLVSCKTINGDFPVPALSILPVFKQLKEKRPCLSILGSVLALGRAVRRPVWPRLDKGHRLSSRPPPSTSSSCCQTKCCII